MQLLFGYRIVSTTFFTTLLHSAPISLFAPVSDCEARRREFVAARELARLRRRVLRRDRYRCRGCDRGGLDVTLAIHAIHDDAAEEEETLTLCRQCFEIAAREKIVGRHIPDFLMKLWSQIHSKR